MAGIASERKRVFEQRRKNRKRYRSDLNRTRLLEVLGKYDFEGVSQVAIDEDWSALRVRPVNEIKRLTRKTAMSEKGKTQLGKQPRK
jgi:hypothetical protein